MPRQAALAPSMRKTEGVHWLGRVGGKLPAGVGKGCEYAYGLRISRLPAGVRASFRTAVGARKIPRACAGRNCPRLPPRCVP